MTLNQFNELEKSVQINVINSYGELLLCKIHKLINYELYQLDSFYVEITRNISGTTLHTVYAFNEDAMLLDLYIEDMDISNLLQVSNE